MTELKHMKVKLAALFLIAVLSGCAYSFGGASIPPSMKTVTVRFFENNAPVVIPTLSQQFTEALKSRIRNQTRLSLTQNDGEAIFEGRITGYDIKPVAIQANSNPTAGANRLTITVSVKFTNTIDPKGSFEQSFSQFYDLNLNGAALQSVLPAAIDDINKKLTEDVFNRAFAQW